jgi:phosphoribosylanthranilate isomerase
MVGVFVDESIENVSRIADEAGLDGIQLHGEETAEYCRRLKELCPQKFLIKAIAAKENAGVEIAGLYPADAIMIDAFDEKLRGGTGRVADWSIAREVARVVPRLFLAGGLSPENVAEAIAAVGPYGVDVCSAVEAAPGRKSAERMKQFVDAVRSSKLQDETAAAGEGN